MNNLTNRENAVRIITESFQDNPSVVNVLKPGGDQTKKLDVLAKYAYDTSVSRNGVYFSSDGEGVAFCYRYNFKNEGINDYLNQVKLVLGAIGINRLLEVMKRDNYIKSIRPKDGDFLYFWFFGVSNQGRGGHAAWEIKETIFRISEEKKLPIYLETSVPQNKRIYKRYGFETYHEWSQAKGKKPLWFMRRPCL